MYRGQNPSGFNIDTVQPYSGYWWVNKSSVSGTWPTTLTSLTWGALLFLKFPANGFALQFFANADVVLKRLYINGAWTNWSNV